MYGGMGLMTGTSMLVAVMAREKALGRSANEDEFEPINWRTLKAARGYTAGELVVKVTGKPLSHQPLIAHLRRKLAPLYGLD